MRRSFYVWGWIAALWFACPGGAAGASGWSVQPTPNPSGSLSSDLLGVSCTGPSACTAVGFTHPSTGPGVTLAEHWNGRSWEIEPSPSPSGATFTTLYGVSCPSANACTAVGDYQTGTGADVSLAERWNGAAWEIQPTPNPAGASLSVLYGVSCPTASTCTAVGENVTSTGTAVTLAERWNGAAWELQPTLNPADSTFSIFGGLSCSGKSACTAVGTYDTSDGQHTLAERWNGIAWRAEPTVNPTGTGALGAVSCPRRRACTAVGFDEPSPTSPLPLAESWSRGVWTVQPTPNPAGASGGALSAVSCPARRACTAVGGGSSTLAESWNGTTWELQPTPNPAGASALSGVSCPTRTDCIAVGTSVTNLGAATQVTLAEGFSS